MVSQDQYDDGTEQPFKQFHNLVSLLQIDVPTTLKTVLLFLIEVYPSDHSCELHLLIFQEDRDCKSPLQVALGITLDRTYLF